MAAVGKRALHELGLPTRAVHRGHHPAGDIAGRGCAVVGADHVKAQIDAGGHSCAGEDLSFVDVEHAGVDPDRRVSGGELIGMLPMGCCLAPVE